MMSAIIREYGGQQTFHQTSPWTECLHLWTEVSRLRQTARCLLPKLKPVGKPDSHTYSEDKTGLI